MSVENQVQAVRYAVEMKIELHTLVERGVSHRLNMIDDLLHTVSGSSAYKQPYQLWRTVAQITLLLCYIKRKSNLIFLARENDRINISDLAQAMDELSQCSVAAKIHSRVRNDASGFISPKMAFILYDSFQTVLEEAVLYSNSALIVDLCNQYDEVKMLLMVKLSHGKLKALSNHNLFL